MGANISSIVHPEYAANLTLWQKYRLVAEAGDPFLKQYLKQFSRDEDVNDFYRRMEMTPIPAHAKSSLVDIKNAIYQRMVDITRANGPSSYQSASMGRNGGVDRKSNSLNGFIGMTVLPELLALGKVGVLVDRVPLPENASEADRLANPPYLVCYSAEDIRSWSEDTHGEINVLLLRSYEYATDEDTQLTTGRREVYLHFIRVPGGVLYTKYVERKVGQTKTWGPDHQETLAIPRIPFVLFQLTDSLLADVANHQIALLNMGSSDVDYAIRANFPFYTEQVDMATALMQLQASQTVEYSDDGSLGDSDARKQAAESRKVKTGLSRGRTYPKGLERPGFIAPPTDPLEVSMKKEEKLVEEIRRLINLALTSISPNQASMAAREMDNRGLEAGLSFIGMELERGEREIGIIWAEFEGSKEYPTIAYPRNYSLRTDDQRLDLADKTLDVLAKIPSRTVQREMAKEVASLCVGHRLDYNEMLRVLDEIDKSEVVVVDPEAIHADHESGFVGTALASKLRGYPEGESGRAAVDHAERLARIQAAQTSPVQGLKDAQGDPNDGENRKTASQNPDLTPDGERKVRGDE